MIKVIKNMRNFRIMNKVLLNSRMKSLQQNSYKYVIDLDQEVTYEAGKERSGYRGCASELPAEESILRFSREQDVRGNLRKPKRGVGFSNLGGRSGAGTAEVSSILAHGRDSLSGNHVDEGSMQEMLTIKPRHKQVSFEKYVIDSHLVHVTQQEGSLNTEVLTIPAPDATPDETLNTFHKYPDKEKASNTSGLKSAQGAKMARRLTTLAEQQLEDSKGDIALLDSQS